MPNQEPQKVKIEIIKQKLFPIGSKSMQRVLIYGGVAIFLFLAGSIALSDYYLLKKITELELRLPATEVLEKLHEKPKPPEVTLPKTLYNLSGPIKNLEWNSLVIEASLFEKGKDGQVVQKTETRRVLIAPTTKFSRLVFVTEEATGRRTPQETPISFRDLKIGDYIEVVSTKDISESQEFEATQIRILPRTISQ